MGKQKTLSEERKAELEKKNEEGKKKMLGHLEEVLREHQKAERRVEEGNSPRPDIATGD